MMENEERLRLMAEEASKEWARKWSRGMAGLFPAEMRPRIEDEAKKSAEEFSKRWIRSWVEAMRE